MKHTGGRLEWWENKGCGQPFVISQETTTKDKYVDFYDKYVAETNNRANAQRIVACWNACLGINPEAVLDLLEALKQVSTEWAVSDGPVTHNSIHAQSLVKQAIAKATN